MIHNSGTENQSAKDTTAQSTGGRTLASGYISVRIRRGFSSSNVLRSVNHKSLEVEPDPEDPFLEPGIESGNTDGNMGK